MLNPARHCMLFPNLTSFQSCSPNSGGFTGRAGVPELRIAAIDEVSTTLFKVAFALMQARMTFSVPFSAGSTNCLTGSVMPVTKNGDAVWNTKCDPLRKQTVLSVIFHHFSVEILAFGYGTTIDLDLQHTLPNLEVIDSDTLCR